MITYGIQKEITGDFLAILAKVKIELAKEGFGILTEINVSETLKKKLNIDYPHYVILGTCNPHSAYAALQVEKEIGLLLPCNVILYENDGKIMVAAIRPIIAMQIIDNSRVAEIAKEVEKKLKKVITLLR